MPINISYGLAALLKDTEGNVKYDSAAKSAIAFKPVLSVILRDCVDAFKGCSAKEIQNKYLPGSIEVTQISEDLNGDLSVETLSQEFGGIRTRKTIFDIRFRARLPSGGEAGIIINVEAQGDASPGYELVTRGIYNGGLMLGDQTPKVHIPNGISEEQQSKILQKALRDFYKNLEHVYSIWICFDPLIAARNAITAYEIQPRCIHSNYVVSKENYDKLTVVMVYLNPDAIEQDLKSGVDTLDMLNTLFASELDAEEKINRLEDEYNILLQGKVAEEVMGMCNLSVGIARHAAAKAVKERDKAIMKRMYKMDNSVQVIAETLEYSPNVVMEVLRESGIQVVC